MMQIIPILFYFMISLSQAKGDHLQQEDGYLDTHQESELLTVRSSGVCPPNFEPLGNECFFFHEDQNEALNWDESRARCKNMGGDLAQPQNMIDFVQYIKENYPNSKSTIWLGATDRNVEGEWKWVTGEAVPEDMWEPWPHNQPSGDGNCMEIHYYDHTDFYMNDWYCYQKGHYACEIEPIRKVENPYIEPKCCNYSTTSACSNMFHYTGGRGSCIPQNETCYGKEYKGSYYCSINNLQSCKCCVPTDCAQQTLSPCAKLNGTCMGINDECNGESVTGKEFCKQDTKNETCKCCYHPDCPCGQDYNGGCTGGLAYGNMLMKTRGLCKKSCDVETPLPLSGNACNKTGGKDCKCCTDCGVGMCKGAQSCMCMTNGNQCPKGYCTPGPIGGPITCPEGSCSCCLPQPPEVLNKCKCVTNGNQCSKGYCTPGPIRGPITCPEGSCFCCSQPPACYSIHNLCDAPNDYCVRKLENSVCPAGFAKVYNICNGKKKNVQTRRAGALIKEDSSCDCCKSTACSSIRDLCTGPGSYCIDQKETCEGGYDESLDCSKPIIVNGTWITSKLCKCCKPKLNECGDIKQCFRVGNQCFMRMSYNTNDWRTAGKYCDTRNNTLAVPEYPQAVAQHLTNNYGDESYWIGAHGTSNGSSIWVTGGVIGPKAPWFANYYEKCDVPNECMELRANIGCINHNQCFGCSRCNGGIPRTPLCSCENSWENDDDK